MVDEDTTIETVEESSTSPELEAFFSGEDVEAAIENTEPTEEPKQDDLELPDNSSDDETKEEKEEDKFDSPFGDELDKLEKGEEETKGFDEDEFDKQTKNDLEEMLTDDHPGHKYKKLREELKENIRQLEKVKAEGFESDELVELRAKVEAYEQQQGDYEELKQNVALNDYRRTDEYMTTVAEPYQDIVEVAGLLEKHAGLDEGTLLNAITNKNQAAQDSAIEEISHNLDARTLSRVNNMADKMLELYRRDESIKTSAAERLEKYNERKASESAVEAEKRKGEYTSSVESTFNKFQDKIPALLSNEGEKSEVFNSALAKAKDLDFDDLDNNSKAFAAMSATVMPELVKDIKKLQSSLRDKNELIKALRGSKPNASGANPTEVSSKPNAEEEALAWLTGK